MNLSAIRKVALVACLSFFTTSIAGAQTTIYVDDNGPSDPLPGDPSQSDPQEDGTMLHPYDAIQEAVMVAAQGDIVMVRDGIYTGLGNRDIEIFGFPGLSKAITVQSESGPVNTIIDCQQQINARGFYIQGFGSLPGSLQATISGLTINHCPARGIDVGSSAPTIDNCFITNNGFTVGGSVTAFGGGIQLISSPAIISNCTISGNKATSGGGAMLWKSSAIISNCEISGNIAMGGQPLGGGIYIFEVSPAKPALIDGCTIVNNAAGDGGGIFVDGSPKPSSADVNNCIIANNTAVFGSGGQSGAGGGVAFIGSILGSRLRIVNTQIIGNESGFFGGGVFANNGADDGPVTLTNCVVSGNVTGGAGGGLFLDGSTFTSNKEHKIINTTVFSNTSGAQSGGGGIRAASATIINNTIVWDNWAVFTDYQTQMVINELDQISTETNLLIVSFTDVQAGASGITNCGSCWGAGNIDADPLFVDPLGTDLMPGTLDDDLRIMLTTPPSPVIDAGDSTVLPFDVTDLDNDLDFGEIVPLDLDLGLRQCDEPSVIDTGSGDCVIVDMGAYEVPCGDSDDCNGNNVVDICECPAANIDFVNTSPPNGTVDARQPHSINDANDLQGIGDPRMSNPTAAQDDITIVLDDTMADASDPACWSLCETVADPNGANSITGVTDIGGGQYEIALARPITAKAVTTIRYLGGTDFVEYISHPANANADSRANTTDIISLVNYFNGVQTPPHGIYSTDMDHSGVFNASDSTRLVDLLNGAGAFDPWFFTFKPNNTGCPDNGCIASGSASQMAPSSAPLSSATLLANPTALPNTTSTPVSIEPTPAENLAFAQYFVDYVSSATPQSKLDHLEFEIIVETLTSWAIDHFSPAEREALADELLGLEFSPASRDVERVSMKAAELLRA